MAAGRPRPHRSVSTPDVDIIPPRSRIGDDYPPVMVLFHPSMERLARKIVKTASARMEKLSLAGTKVEQISHSDIRATRYGAQLSRKKCSVL